MKNEFHEVFNISNNLYTYDDAQAICTAYGASIATYDQVEQAYENGGEWCNYGWTDEQMALFPTQKSTWLSLQKNPLTQNNCGRPGINGGHVDDPNTRYGVNCYGVRPKTSLLYENNLQMPEVVKVDPKVEFWKKHMSSLEINSFNKDIWSEKSITPTPNYNITTPTMITTLPYTSTPSMESDTTPTNTFYIDSENSDTPTDTPTDTPYMELDDSDTTPTDTPYMESDNSDTTPTDTPYMELDNSNTTSTDTPYMTMSYTTTPMFTTFEQTTFSPTTPSQTTPGYTTAYQTTPGYTTASQTTPGYTTASQTTPGYTTAYQTTPGYTTAYQTTPGYTTPMYTTAGQTTFSPTTLRQTTPMYTTAGQTTFSPTTPGQTTPMYTTAGQTTFIPTTAGQTTFSPTTAGQTTFSPTTPGQTTQYPTTPGQTTQYPTTAGQTTFSPTTAEQTTQYPTTAGQTTFSPTTAEQTTFSPTTAGQTTFSPTTPGQTTQYPTTPGQTTQYPTTPGQTTFNITPTLTLLNNNEIIAENLFIDIVNISTTLASKYDSKGNLIDPNYQNFVNNFRNKMNTLYSLYSINGATYPPYDSNGNPRANSPDNKNYFIGLLYNSFVQNNFLKYTDKQYVDINKLGNYKFATIIKPNSTDKQFATILNDIIVYINTNNTNLKNIITSTDTDNDLNILKKYYNYSNTNQFVLTNISYTLESKYIQPYMEKIRMLLLSLIGVDIKIYISPPKIKNVGLQIPNISN